MDFDDILLVMVSVVCLGLVNDFGDTHDVGNQEKVIDVFFCMEMDYDVYREMGYDVCMAMDCVFLHKNHHSHHHVHCSAPILLVLA